jgi:hypothetical protein
MTNEHGNNYKCENNDYANKYIKLNNLCKSLTERLIMIEINCKINFNIRISSKYRKNIHY